ncbi:MAG: aspartate aminotransferase family protein [Halobacteriovorax sp.]|nr:aspartate aminotransferase family protein [Halobacteriovorax sp.]|tara:strand:+ start:145709 stop:147004 length:1296 start_codon:yes stop_codon:yes gene_type:complete
MEKFEELFSRSQAVTPGGVHSPVRAFKGLDQAPIFFKSGEGPFLKDQNNKSYLDLCSSFGPLILGHRDPEVQRSIESIIDKAWSFGAPEAYSLELAEWITNEIPWIEKIRFVNSGTEAVMTALRLAKGYTGKNKILKFDGCYHGHVDSMLVASGSGLAGTATASSAGISDAVAKETLVCKLDDIEAVKGIFKREGNDIAAVIIEPLPANYGLLPQRKEFLQFLREITKENNSLLIFDEVISGFRVALGGMAEISDVVPDLVTYGKIIGGGFPVGAFAGSSKVMDMMAPTGPVYQAGTLSGNPICMVAGLNTLKKIKRDNLIEKTNLACEKFTMQLNEGFSQRKIPMQCIQFASLFFITSKTSKPIRSIDHLPKEHGTHFCKLYPKYLKKGLYMAPAAFEVGFFSSVIDEKLSKKAAQDILEVCSDYFNERK